MQIRVGCELIYECPQPTPMILMLNIHFTRASDIVRPDHMVTVPSLPISAYRDSFGNWCSRIVAPAGADAHHHRCPGQRQRAARCRRCRRKTDPGRVAARGDADLSPRQPLLRDRTAVCRSPGSCSATLPPAGVACRPSATSSTITSNSAISTRGRRRRRGRPMRRRPASAATTPTSPIAFCRCMNIPARYCTGYLGDIGMPPPYGPMDFAGWFEAWLDGRWYTFDAAEQRAAHRAHLDGARPRRRRCGHQHDVRSQHPAGLQGVDGRGGWQIVVPSEEGLQAESEGAALSPFILHRISGKHSRQAAGECIVAPCVRHRADNERDALLGDIIFDDHPDGKAPCNRRE